MVHKLRDLFENSIRARWLFLVTAAGAVVILVFTALMWAGDDPASASERPTDTPVETNTPTDTPTITDTPTQTFTPTDTPTNTPTDTPTDTPTNTPTFTPTPLQKPLSQADSALLDLAAGQKVWCGVATLGEPWELHVSVTPGTANGGVLITFDDATSVTFLILANNAFSLTQAMGGRPTVDGLVLVEITAGTGAVGMVSALARPDSADPFTESTPVSDNYCIAGTSATAGDDGAGVVSANAQIPY